MDLERNRPALVGARMRPSYDVGIRVEVEQRNTPPDRAICSASSIADVVLPDPPFGLQKVITYMHRGRALRSQCQLYSYS